MKFPLQIVNQDDHIKNILSAKRNNLAALMREGRVPTSSDPRALQ